MSPLAPPAQDTGMPVERPGRHCPRSYRHGPEALATAPTMASDTAWIIGGLYGNVEALAAILDRVAGEPAMAVPIAFDGAAWRERFLHQWPSDSPAHASYRARLFDGPPHRPEDARPVVRPAAVTS